MNVGVSVCVCECVCVWTLCCECGCDYKVSTSLITHPQAYIYRGTVCVKCTVQHVWYVLVDMRDQ